MEIPPGMKNGVAVDVALNIEVNFSLSKWFGCFPAYLPSLRACTLDIISPIRSDGHLYNFRYQRQQG